MKRITPEEVVATYRSSGWIPVDCQLSAPGPDGQMCGCAIGVMMDSESRFYCDSEGWARKNGYDVDYVDGFMTGFDGCPITGLDESLSADQGFKDGKETRLLVKAQIGNHMLSPKF